MIEIAKYIIITIVLICSQDISGQGIYKAIILDQSTNQPIENANALIVNSSEGYYSDKKGFIHIPEISASGVDIIISHVNYGIGTKYIPLQYKGVDTIRLIPKSYEIEDVTIKSVKNDLKERRLKVFRKDLFDFTHGKKNMYKQVDFINPEDLLFFTKNDIFQAKSSELLEFKNKYLGYDIKCLLGTYVSNFNGLKFEGKAIYQEYDASKKKTKKFLKRRNKLWKTTQQNFLRQIIFNELDTKSFSCKALVEGRFEEGYLPITDFNTFVYPTKIEGVYALISPSPITIEYGNRRSHIIAKEGIVLLNKSGLILNKKEIRIVGDWSQRSLTESLPTDFESIPTYSSPFQQKLKRSISELRIIAKNLKSSTDLNIPIDEVFIETDKFLYNSTERIFIGAHVYDHRTRSPIDNCLIKIEMVDDEGKIIATKTKKVLDGTALTSFLFTDSIPTGQYGIRAYTNHMRNFSENLYGKTTIAIDQVLLNTQMEELSQIHINFAPEGGKLLYELENRIVAHITDDKGRPVSFSGTLTDNLTREQITVKTITDGLAIFNLLPNKKSTYALTSNSNQPISSNINQLIPTTGAIVQVYCRNKDRYKVSILAKHGYHIVNKFNISNKGESVYSADPDSISIFSISKEYLPNEILAFQLLDKDSLILSERLVDNRKTTKPLIRFEKKYEFFYNNQQCEINIVPNLNSDLFIDSLKWSIRVIDEEAGSTVRNNQNLTQNFELSDEINGITTTNQNYIQNINLIGNSFLPEYESAYKQNIDDLTYKEDFTVSIIGDLKNPDFPNQPEEGRLSITSMSKIPYAKEISTDKDGKFDFGNLPYESNLNFIIQARKGVDEDDQLLDGNRYLNINIDTIDHDLFTSATTFHFRNDLIPNDSLITYRKQYYKSITEGIELDEIMIKAKVSSSIGSGLVKDIEEMDWIPKEARGQFLLSQIYPSKILRRNIKNPSQLEIRVKSNSGFVFRPLLVYLNGSLEFNSSIFLNLTADRIKYFTLSKNVISIITNPGMQSRTEIREKSLGIKSHIIPETRDDTNIDELNDISFREFSFLSKRKILYWKPNTYITKSNSNTVIFRSSDRTGTYKMVASTIHPLLGYISYSIPFEIAESKK